MPAHQRGNTCVLDASAMGRAAHTLAETVACRAFELFDQFGVEEIPRLKADPARQCAQCQG